MDILLRQPGWVAWNQVVLAVRVVIHRSQVLKIPFILTVRNKQSERCLAGSLGNA